MTELLKYTKRSWVQFSSTHTAAAWIVILNICVFCITESPASNRKVLDDTIVLHNAKASDSAVYQCQASNRHGTLLSNANIMIMSKYNSF